MKEWTLLDRSAEDSGSCRLQRIIRNLVWTCKVEMSVGHELDICA